jgi:hypothetical protein
MSSGFNTDVRHRGHVLHIQTEDRGPTHPSIDTVVYQNGRVLCRKSQDYAEFMDTREFTADWLQARVAEHHRSIIEDLRAGLLDREISEAVERAGRESGIRIRLLNPDSWFASGSISLNIQVSRRADGGPQPGAEVAATIEGAIEKVWHSGRSDHQGLAQIQFPLPALGKGELTLVISARADGGPDEIRFSMRSRSGTSSPLPRGKADLNPRT